MTMARMARVIVPWYPHHITQRGNRRQQTFWADQGDYEAYIELMADWCHQPASPDSGTVLRFSLLVFRPNLLCDLGGSAVITWDDSGGRRAYVIRPGDRWIATGRKRSGSRPPR